RPAPRPGRGTPGRSPWRCRGASPPECRNSRTSPSGHLSSSSPFVPIILACGLPSALVTFPAPAHPLAWLEPHAARRRAQGLRRELRPRTPDEPLLDLAGNDYLGLACDPRVVEGGVRALRTWGAGSTGSR